MITHSEYFKEVKSTASDLVFEALKECSNDSEQAMELINDGLLQEWVAGHEWVIYNAYHLAILQHSSNDEYMIDNLGEDSAASTLKEGGLSGLHCALAFWAMYADIQDILSETMDDLIESLEDN